MAVIIDSLESFQPRAKLFVNNHCNDDGNEDETITLNTLSYATTSNSLIQNPNKCAFLPNSWTKKEPQQCWTIRKVEAGEEELYAKGKFVYWTRGQGPIAVVIKTFNFSEIVLKVFWCEFSGKDYVCVVVSSGLHLFNKTGNHYQVPLPFTFDQIYPTNFGIIIERKPDAESDPTLPVLFSLPHPTSEVSPVIMKTASSKANPNQRHQNKNQPLSCQSDKNSSFLLPNLMSVVACHQNLPLCLLYNHREKHHTMWWIRPTKETELEDFKNRINTCAPNMTNSIGYKDSISLHNSTASFNLPHSSPVISFSPLAASRLGSGSHQIPENPASSLSFDMNSTMKLMSTPTSKNVINYLRDDIEGPILPDMALEQIWSEKPSGLAKAEKFFSTLDFVGSEYLVITSRLSNSAKIIRYEVTNDKSNLALGQTKMIDALDAISIPSLKMMIVIEPNKNLYLYSGFNKVSMISVTSIDTISKHLPSMPLSRINTPSESPFHMSSARKRSSLGDKSIDDNILKSMFQHISPVPHASSQQTNNSTMCSSDIKSLMHVLDQTLLVADSSNQLAKIQIPKLSTTSAVSLLLDTMKSLVSRDLGLMLLSKWYAARRISDHPDFMTAHQEIIVFKKWFMNCLGITGDYFEKSNICNIDYNYASPQKRSRKVRDSGDNPILTNVYSFFIAIHLVYEEFKLNTTTWENAYHIADLLMVLSCILKEPNYQEYYWQNFPELQHRYKNLKTELENLFPRSMELMKPSFFKQNPPSVLNLVKLVVGTRQERIGEDQDFVCLDTYPVLPEVTCDSNIVLTLFCGMFGIDPKKILINLSQASNTFPENHKLLINSTSLSSTNDEEVVLLLTEFGKNRDYLQCLPQGYALFLWQSILNCRNSPPTTWSEECYTLIGRKDLVCLVGKTSIIEDIMPTITEVEENPTTKNTSKTGQLNQRLQNVDLVAKLLFPDDQRVIDAHKMLASDVNAEFNMPARQGATEAETREETNKHICLLNMRTMARPIGRGAINLRSYSPVIGQVFKIPKLNLSTKNRATDRIMEFSHDQSVFPWAHFHNGVAEGLRICASSSRNIIDSTWINYSRPKSNVAPRGSEAIHRENALANINYEHAGFLFALGLNGHLAKLSVMTIHDHLCHNNELIRVAILLGLSAAKRGTCDKNMIKVLSIHIDALLPPTSTELDVPTTVKVASIIGVGLLYQGSSDSHLSKVLLDEIGRLPDQEANSLNDRESYSLSAGLAFGLVNLCKGSSKTKVSATSVIMASDQLRHYMLGGKRKQLTTSQRQKYMKQDSHRGEAEFINPHVTSPGGTLALGLMYHRSENKSVADWMKAPDTQSLLEYVRPDLLLLRMLSYGLIMWKEIEPNEKWIDSKIPDIVKKHAFQRSTNENDDDSLNFVLPCSGPVSIDYETMSQTYCNIVAGCCMAVGLRFAGSANKLAFKVIYKFTKMFINLSNKPTLAELAGRTTIESCLNVLITSLAVVMAGTGDLEVLRMCRYLRSRIMPSSIFHGSYMAVHMAIGILFLGGCRYSLSTSPQAISALVCALYPMYPNHPADNRYHLQALRHLYVLASEPRLFIPIDIHTKEPTYVWISLRQRKHHKHKQLHSLAKFSESTSAEIETPANRRGKFTQESSDSNSDERDTVANDCVVYRMKAPCLIPEVESVISLCVDDDRYWRVNIDNEEALKKCLFKESGCIYVKQKTKHSDLIEISNEGDPLDLQDEESVRNDFLNSYGLLQQTNDPLVTNLSNFVIRQMVLGDSQLQLMNIIKQCVKRDRVELLAPIYSLITLSSSLLQSDLEKKDDKMLTQEDVTEKKIREKLILQQLKLASTSIDLSNKNLSTKINVFKPILGLLDSKNVFESSDFDDWIGYSTGEKNWTNSSEKVVNFLVLHDMEPSCEPLSEDIVELLKELQSVPELS